MELAHALGGLAGRFGRAVVLPARAVAGLLGIEAVVDHVDDDLGLALRLHPAAHDAIGQPRLAVLAGETGDDGVEGPLARGIDVGMAVGQGEQLAPILEHEAQGAAVGAVGHKARTHAAIVGLDPTDHHPVLVGHAEIGGVALGRGVAGEDAVHDAVGADQLGALGGVGLGVQPGGRGLGEALVGEVAGAVLEGQPLGLGLMVDGGGGLEAHALEVELLADVQDLVGRQALGVRPQRIDLDPAIGGHQRLDPFGAVGGQVGAGHPAADTLEIALDVVGDGAVIEGVASALGDQAVGAAQVGIGEDLARLGRAAAGQPDLPAVVVLLDDRGALVEIGHAPLEVVGHDLGHGHALFTQLGDGQQDVLPRQLAVALVGAPPGVDRAGHVDGHGAVFGQVAVGAGLGPGRRQRQRERTVSRAVEADDLLLGRVPHQAEGVAADAVGGRLQETEGGVDGDGGVDGRAAAPQGVQADQGGGGVGGGGGAVGAPDRRAADELGSGHPVADADAGVGIRRRRGWRRGLGARRRGLSLGGAGQQGAGGQGGQKGTATHDE
ncbi:hypothetical protein D3C77_257460 [compost metagenome]